MCTSSAARECNLNDSHLSQDSCGWCQQKQLNLPYALRPAVLHQWGPNRGTASTLPLFRPRGPETAVLLDTQLPLVGHLPLYIPQLEKMNWVENCWLHFCSIYLDAVAVWVFWQLTRQVVLFRATHSSEFGCFSRTWPKVEPSMGGITFSFFKVAFSAGRKLDPEDIL